MGRSERDDAQLVQESRAGQAQAFACLVERYKSLICAMTYSAVGDVGLSQDLAQETFVVAWRKLPQVDDSGRFRAWLCGVARKVIQQALRTRRRDVIHGARQLDASRSETDGLPTPRETAISKERARVVADALGRLPESYRLPLVLYYFEGCSTTRTADLLGLSEAAVRQRLSRGRRLLREQVLALVSETLDGGRPGKTFTMGVLNALRVAPYAAPTAAAAQAGKMAVAGDLLAGKGLKAALAAMIGLVGALGALTLAAKPSASSAEGSQEPPGMLSASLKEESEASVPSSADEDGIARQSEAGLQNVAPAETPKAERAASEVDVVLVGDPLEADGVKLAAEVLERAWREVPMQAAPGLCLEGWAYLAALGDDDARERLLGFVTSLDPDRAPKASQLLSCILNDRRAAEFALDVVQDASAPELERTFGAWLLETATYGGFYSPREPMPPAAVDYMVSLVEREGPAKGPMIWLGKHATERARLVAEDALLSNTYDPTGPKNVPRRTATSFRRAQYRSVPAQAGVPSYCVASWSLDILERIANPASSEAVRTFAAYTDYADLVPAAAGLLDELGDRLSALCLLRDGFEAASRIEERMPYASGLYEMGQKEYLEAIHGSLDHPDRKVRLQAYATLCYHEDPSFIEPATADFENYESRGFWSIHRGIERRRSEHQADGIVFDDFCLALATESNLPEARSAGLNMLFTGPAKQARHAAAVCRTALDGPLPRRIDPYDRRPTREEQWLIDQLAFLLRWGEAGDQERAVQRIQELYRIAPGLTGSILLKLKWGQCRGILPLLTEALRTNPHDNERIFAAVAYLATESGKVFY